MDPPPWKMLDPPPPPGKCWTPSETLKNDRFLWNWPFDFRKNKLTKKKTLSELFLSDWPGPPLTKFPGSAHDSHDRKTIKLLRWLVWSESSLSTLILLLGWERGSMHRCYQVKKNTHKKTETTPLREKKGKKEKKNKEKNNNNSATPSSPTGSTLVGTHRIRR